MIRSLLLALVLSLLGFPGSLRAELPAEPRLAQKNSDLSPDPRVRFGQLPNGLRYAILPNHEPRDRASFRLLVLAGSAQESDEQLGLAHFVEHMAFNGTQHYPPGTLIEVFQRLGMNFGGDTNANTGFDRTVYLMELPNTQPKSIEEACTVFSDFAHGELLNAKEVENERGIILSEKRDRDSVEYRRSVAVEKFLLETTLIPKRLTIGSAEVISHAPPETLRAYYETWYRPERMAVVAVGDFDVDVVEKAIQAKLSSWSAKQPSPRNPSLGEIPSLKEDRVLYRHEPEAGETVVMVYNLLPYSHEDDTRANRLKYLPRELALSMLNRRLSILARQGDAPFIGAGAQVEETLDFYRSAGFQLTCKPEQWTEALAVGEKELRRALEHGFAPAELKEAVTNFRHGLEEAVKTAPTRRSEALADHLVDSLLEDYVFTTPEEDLKLQGPALEKITLDQCVQALRETFPPTKQFIAVVGNAKLGPDSAGPAPEPSPESQILAAYQAAVSAPVEGPAEVADTEFGYQDFGTPGKVAEKTHVQDLDLDLITLSNGVRLNLKKTDFESNRIYVSVRIGTGKLTQPQDKPGLSTFCEATLLLGGVGKHTFDDIIRIAAGKTGGLDFTVGNDALVFSGGTNREDLLFQLEAFAAYVTDSAYRSESVATAHKSIEPMYQRLEHTPSGPIQLQLLRELASGDTRFGLPAKDALFSRTLDEARAWLEPQFKEGAIEIALVGDLEADQAIAAVEKTFGALPKRSSKPALEKERAVAIPAHTFTRDFTVETEIPHGLVALFWPSMDSRDVHRDRRARLLADVFADRLRVEVREKLGDAYSPSASHSAGETYPNYGWFSSYVETDPAKTQLIMDSVLKIAGDLAKNGVTEEELDRARKPILTSLRESSRTNAYWLNVVLNAAQEFPWHLDWCRSRYSDTESITKADLDVLARDYLTPDKAFRATVIPKKKP